MSKMYRVGVVGATGVVGRALVAILESRRFPVSRLRLLASERSAGQTLSFRGESIPVEVLSDATLDDLDIALFSAGGAVSQVFCPLAAAKGIVCIDNTSHFRMDPTVPLVVPEVNPQAIHGHANIIANPNCSTAQMMVVLKPIMDAVGLMRIVVSTYQSVSGAGSEAMQELADHTRAYLAGEMLPGKRFPHSIAFNVIPQIDAFTPTGYTKEELKMIHETKKILGDDTIRVSATTVRVPVFTSHSESINIQTRDPISVEALQSLLLKAPGVRVMTGTDYPTPRDVAGKDDVYVGRIRQDLSQENGIEMWCVGDNLRKGAALNAVQIAELLV